MRRAGVIDMIVQCLAQWLSCWCGTALACNPVGREILTAPVCWDRPPATVGAGL